jgi:transcriptional regulator with XRE-family HTH domain
MIRKRRFRSALLKFREERDLSQTDLGDRIDRSRQTVANWEHGRYTPSDDALQALQAIGFDSTPFMAPEISGSTIRRWRKRRGLSQPELAAALGVSTPAVSHWERLRKTPRPDIRHTLFMLGCPDDHGRVHQHEKHPRQTGTNCPHYNQCKQLVDHDLWALCYEEPPTAGELLRAAEHLELGTFDHDPDLTEHIIETLALNALEEAMAQVPSPAQLGHPPRTSVPDPMERVPLWI